MPVVVECVQHKFDEVVVKNIFAARETGAQPLRFSIKANEDRVKVLGIVAKIDLGALGHGRAVARYSLAKLFGLRELSLPGRTRFHGKKFFNSGSTVDAWDANFSKVGIGGKQGGDGAHERQQR